ncbi:hypothetical protein ANN_06826 [Periplaneta americana]|uniref:Uncharacterized protein n=1 Tax=Periplaneta americana TaxID=6978 RepID=A0ABQ8TGH6_PERAM|nr:hypothetical protein ANN_06826 [Periplaneta americana]
MGPSLSGQKMMRRHVLYEIFRSKGGVFFHWGIIKQRVSKHRYQTIEDLKQAVRRRVESVKWTGRIRNETALERVGEERIMLELISKRKRNWLGHWLRRNCLLKDALEGMSAPTEGLLLVDVMPHGTTINSDGYVATLKKLQVRLSRVRRHWETQDVLLLHDKHSHMSITRPQTRSENSDRQH